MRFAYFTLIFAVALTLSVMGFRGMRSSEPPMEVFPDMDRQGKYKPQGASKFFADARADRPPVAGTVARGRSETGEADPSFLASDDFLYRGKQGEAFAKGYPMELTRDFVMQGENRYSIYCAPCHGALGDGNGITKRYGMTVTPSFHDDRLRNMPEGEIFNTITHGKNTMMPYGDKLTPSERWAVVSYVRALQRASNATIDDVPKEQVDSLKQR